MEIKKIKLTDNIKMLVEKLASEKDFLSASEIKEKFSIEKSVQSLNGSLSASAYNEKLFVKSTKIVNDKLVKSYKLANDYTSYIN